MYLLLEILQAILVDTCCFGCNGINYTKSDGFQSPYRNGTYKDFDITLPAENGIKAKTYLGEPFAALIIIQGVSFFAKSASEPTSDMLMSSVLSSIRSAWPLFTMGLVMAIAAGTIIWLLVSMIRILNE